MLLCSVGTWETLCCAIMLENLVSEDKLRCRLQMPSMRIFQHFSLLKAGSFCCAGKFGHIRGQVHCLDKVQFIHTADSFDSLASYINISIYGFFCLKLCFCISHLNQQYGFAILVLFLSIFSSWRESFECLSNV